MSGAARTWTALTTLEGATAAAALAEALEALGPTGVGCFEIEDGAGRWEVGGYFEAEPDGVALALLAAAHGAAAFAVSALEERDWVAQVRRELSPVRAGRVVVHGGHDRDRVPVNAIGLEIEAAMAFGTGHHATTEGCLLAMERLAKRGRVARRVADLGCGTGVLAMAAARIWPARAVATDLDPIAAAAARANAAANGARGRVRVGCAPGLRHPETRAARPVDLVLANILARPLKTLTPEIAAALAPGGVAILSGLLIRQGADVARMARGRGLRLIDRLELRGWATLTLERPRARGGRRAAPAPRPARPPARR